MAGTPPSDLVATVISPTEISIAWQNNDPGYNYHMIQVHRNIAAAGWTQIDTLEGSAEFYEDHGLTSEVEHCYYVVGEWLEPPETTVNSNEDCGTTYAELQAPTELVVEAYADFIELTWKDNSSAEDWFRIERSVDGGGFAYYDRVVANVTYYRDTAVNPGSLYAYQVYAREDPANDSGFSNQDSDTAISAPAAPAGLALEVSANWIRLTWTGVANETGYKVEKSDTGAFGGEEEEFVVGADVTEYLAKDLDASTQYWFRVRAYNGAGNSAYTATEDDTTLATYVRDDFEVMVRDSVVEAIYIAEIDLKMDLTGFTLVSGETFTYAKLIDERGITIDHVWENGEEYAEKASIADVEANASTFYWDGSDRILYVHSSGVPFSDGADPDYFFMEAGFTHRIPNRDFQYADALCTLPPWLSMSSIPGTTQEIKPYYEGNFSLSSGSISFANGESEGEHYFDKRFERFTWIGAKLAVLVGREDFNLITKFKKMFTAFISGQPCNDKLITFPLIDIRDSLARNLVLNRYSVDDYPDIDEDFIGKEIPKAFGLIPPVVAVPIEHYDAATSKSAKFNFHDGRSKVVVLVTVNNTIQTEDTHFYVDLKRSIVIFAVGQDVGEEDIVKVSFVATVDSANDAISNGAEVFKYLMNNKADIEDASLNLDSIYETKYANANEFSAYYFKDTAFDDIIRNIEHTTEAYTIQDGEGRLGIRPQQTTVPLSAKNIVNHQVFDHSQDIDKNSLYWKVNVYYRSDPQSQNWEMVSDQDDEIFWKYGVKKELNIHTYFSSSASASALATNILGLLNKSFMEDTLPMILFDVFPGDTIKFSRDRFYDASGVAAELEVRLLRIEKNPQDGTTRIKAEKI